MKTLNTVRSAKLVSLIVWCLVVSLLMTARLIAEENKTSQPVSRGELLLITGASGTPEYGAMFKAWAENWKSAATQGNVSIIELNDDGKNDLLPKIKSQISQLNTDGTTHLWIVLIGHGTFDDRVARFNVTGPDLEPEMLNRYLQPIRRPTAVINCSSSSAPFVPALSKSGRIVIAATSSGHEVNFSRFGGFLAEAVNDLTSDIDKDQQVSLLEAFLRASHLTESFYTSNGHLPTEHAVLDDNGDGRPVPAEGFDGLRPKHRIESNLKLADGLRSHQFHICPNAHDASLSPEVIAQRDELELQIAALRSQKEQMPEEAYYGQLEKLLLKMARLLIPNSEPEPVR